MTRLALDASVALAWFVDRPAAPLALATREALAAGGRAVIPPLWHLEVANGLGVAERRGYLTPQDIQASLADIESLLISGTLETDPTLASVRRLLVIASHYRLTAYDSAYLEVSQRHGLPLATLDGDLRRAAASAGVELFR